MESFFGSYGEKISDAFQFKGLYSPCFDVKLTALSKYYLFTFVFLFLLDNFFAV